MNIRRVFLNTLIASVAVSAIVGIGVILFGDFGEVEFRILMTTLTITATSILGLACGAYIESGRGNLLPKAGIIFSVVMALMLFLVIWDVLDDSENFIKATGTLSILAVACSHLSLLSLARIDARFAWSRIVAFICVWLLAAILLYIIWLEPDSSSDLVSRIIGILSILIASITVLTPILHKLSGTKRTVQQIRDEIEELG
ncbi:MAG TPA: hypothetical protein VK612_00170 [Pyrinomonadaceae bacterium]|nr:hypothetical protein [Pyrinomonadaceae bacterium]